MPIIFLGQVRSDEIEKKKVSSIEFTAYKNMVLVNTFQDANVDGDNKSSLITAGLQADYKLGDLSLASNLFMPDGKE